jgi:hypothetical protein
MEFMAYIARADRASIDRLDRISVDQVCKTLLTPFVDQHGCSENKGLMVAITMGSF